MGTNEPIKINMLEKDAFSWHVDQSDVPNKSAEEMKKFLDAPVHKLLDKINEILGGDGAQDLTTVGQKLQELNNDKQAKLVPGEGVELADNVISVPGLATKADQTALDGKVDIDTLNEYLTKESFNLALSILHNSINDMGWQDITNNGEITQCAIKDIPNSRCAYAMYDCTLTFGKTDGSSGSILITAGSLLFNVVSRVQSEDGSESDYGVSLYVFPRQDGRNVETDANGNVRNILFRQLVPILPVSRYEVKTFYDSECKQDKLTAGENITIDENNVISAAVDITMDGADLTDYVKKTTIATSSTLGLVCAGNKTDGIGINPNNGRIFTVSASETEIDARSSAYKIIAPCNLDYAIKSGLSKNALEWTDDETKAARDLIGAVGKTEYVSTPTAGQSGTYGVVKLRDGMGISAAYQGAIYVQKATNDEIDERTQQYKPIVPQSLDYAIKVGLTTNKETWTEEEKAAARTLLGASSASIQVIENGTDGVWNYRKWSGGTYEAWCQYEVASVSTEQAGNIYVYAGEESAPSFSEAITSCLSDNSLSGVASWGASNFYQNTIWHRTFAAEETSEATLRVCLKITGTWE